MADKPNRDEKTETALHEALALFISQISNRTSLITVSRVTLESSATVALCHVTVLPEHAGKAAIDFLSRQEKDARSYVRNHVKIGRIPHIQFVLDTAEKTRRLIDSLSS